MDCNAQCLEFGVQEQRILDYLQEEILIGFPTPDFQNISLLQYIIQKMDMHMQLLDGLDCGELLLECQAKVLQFMKQTWKVTKSHLEDSLGSLD